MKPFLFLLAAFVALCLGFLVFIKAPAVSPLPAISEDGSIVIESPKSNSTIFSPFVISGKARGMWYFEAVFPVFVSNSSGAIIGQGQATATSDWMTNDLVPFRAEITFPVQPSKSSGSIIFKNDNPSGQPELQKTFSIPIQF